MIVHTRQRRGWVGLLVAVLLAAGTQVAVQVVAATPASASIGANLYTATSSSNSEPVKTAVARCPAGDRVFGGGAQIINGGSGVVLATMLPFHGNGDGYSVAATERPGNYTANWSVKAYAICGPAIPGLEIVTSVTTGPDKDTQAFCPDGKVVLSTGGAVGATRQGAVLTEVLPWPPGNHVHVSAGVYSGNPPPDFAVFAAAICANEPPGYEVTDRFRFVTGDVATISATCSGRIMLSGGASGTGFDNDIGYLISMYPNLFVYRVQARKAPQAPAEWLVRFWTICVD